MMVDGDDEAGPIDQGKLLLCREPYRDHSPSASVPTLGPLHRRLPPFPI